MDKKEIFYRLANKKEQGGINQSRAFAKMPDKKDFYKAFKPYGEQGRGFYYIPTL